MPKVCRVGDNANRPADSHGKDCCSHNVTGPATAGSPNVSINGRRVLRVGDPGVHSSCCGSNTWVAGYTFMITSYGNVSGALYKGEPTRDLQPKLWEYMLARAGHSEGLYENKLTFEHFQHRKSNLDYVEIVDSPAKEAIRKLIQIAVQGL